MLTGEAKKQYRASGVVATAATAVASPRGTVPIRYTNETLLAETKRLADATNW